MKKTLLLLVAPWLIVAETNNIEVALKALSMKMDYEEYDTSGAILDSERSSYFGNIDGLGVDVAYRYANGLLGGDTSKVFVRFERHKGKSDYTGALLGSGLPYGSHQSQSENIINETEMGISESRSFGAWSITSKVFGGYRNWERLLTASQLETYSWWFWGAGIGGAYDFGNLRIGAETYFKRARKPEMAIDMPGRIVDTFLLGKTASYGLSLPITYRLGNQLSILGGVEYEYLKIADSNSKTGIDGNTYYEPRSDSSYNKLYLGLGYRF